MMLVKNGTCTSSCKKLLSPVKYLPTTDWILLLVKLSPNWPPIIVCGNLKPTSIKKYPSSRSLTSNCLSAIMPVVVAVSIAPPLVASGAKNLSVFATGISKPLKIPVTFLASVVAILTGNTLSPPVPSSPVLKEVVWSWYGVL